MDASCSRCDLGRQSPQITLRRNLAIVVFLCGGRLANWLLRLTAQALPPLSVISTLGWRLPCASCCFSFSGLHVPYLEVLLLPQHSILIQCLGRCFRPLLFLTRLLSLIHLLRFVVFLFSMRQLSLIYVFLLLSAVHVPKRRFCMTCATANVASAGLPLSPRAAAAGSSSMYIYACMHIFIYIYMCIYIYT